MDVDTAENWVNPGPLQTRRVMIATDGSEASEEAAKQALVVLPADSEFFLVMIIDPQEDPMDDAGGIEGSAVDEEQATARYRESVVEAEGSLARTARAFGPAPVPQRVVEHSGDGVGARICELAREEDVTVVVVGSHGHRAIMDVLLGSVSSYVVHHSPCPVLVVRPRDHD